MNIIPVVGALRQRISAELTAMQVYLFFEATARAQGFAKLAEHMAGEAEAETAHARLLLDRLHFLGELPAAPDPPSGGLFAVADPPDAVRRSAALEREAVDGYRDAVRVAVAAGDEGTADLFRRLLVQEEESLNEAETTLEQMKFIGEGLWMAGWR